MNRAPGARWIAFLFGLLLTANGSMRDGGAVAAGELISELQALRLVPEHPTLWGAKASQRFVVLGTFADGLERDVTAHAVLTLSDPTLATIDSGARVTVRADGACDLIAQVGGCKASTRVQFEGSSQTLPFSFARDIGQILTKRGCNTSDCHGSVKGQKGFKLSLNASYPQEDYKWIIEGGVYKVLTTEQSEPPKPRINKEQPEESLILQKPAGVVPHGGGKRLDVGSMDYRTILAWVQNGAPYGEDDGKAPIAIEGLKAFPPDVVLDPQGKHQLLVTALLSNGRNEDVTDQATYTSNNVEVAKVNGDGMVEAVSTGETAIVIRGVGRVASARVGVIAQPIPNYPASPGSRNFVDEHVFAKLRKFNIVPSGLSGDAEFLRRVCLDLTGTLPSPNRARAFLADPDPDKRDKLIEILLASPEYVDFWAYRFGDLFRVHFTARQDLRGTHQYKDWVRNRIALNKPYDQTARELIAVQGWGGTTQHYYRVTSLMTPQEIMAEQMRVFQGLRLECAQCHNHPFEAWSQDQFWGLAAFFGRMTPVNSYLILDLPSAVAGKTVNHPRTKAEVQPAFLDGTTVPESKLDDLRMTLARWMTSAENPYFARATVNRIWGYFFGRGIVEPVDDMRSTNPPTHPKLLDALARHFVERGFDIKDLIRTIVQSRAYQLSGEFNETNRKDLINCSRSLPRMLEAVVLMDAISVVTGVEEVFELDNFAGGGSTPPGTRAIDLIPDISPSNFMDVFGRPNRQALPEPVNDVTVGQALHMLAGSTYTEKISMEGGRVDRLVKSGANNREILEELFLAALCRLPTEYERTELDKILDKDPSRKENVEAVAWALISSREFAYNH